eukprot:GHVQ01025038.1.p1 GENE.GHVQ01025038.1~~GHVQ01025038.1.p1  ORF type:complete len:323 (+),score=31.12 GHVQ01025038.1:243-1211(+)
MSLGTDTLVRRGVLEGHTDWVTAISAPQDTDSSTIISSSRDKRVIVWQLDQESDEFGKEVGYARKALTGHSQCVQDVVISSDGQFALSGSWDRSLRLWDLSRGETVRSFKGHTSDVNSVAFSADNRQIVSGSRDKTIKLWNTLADCKYTIVEDQHTDWVSCVRFSPSAKQPLIVSCGWDKLVKVWSLQDCKLRFNLAGHTSVLYAVTISPDGSLCASGGKDGVAMLWDVNEGKHLYSLESGSTINALCFSPCNYWLCAATDKSIKIWDLENKNVLSALTCETPMKSGIPWCTSLNWSADGRTLFAGATDGKIYVYEVSRNLT